MKVKNTLNINLYFFSKYFQEKNYCQNKNHLNQAKFLNLDEKKLNTLKKHECTIG